MSWPLVFHVILYVLGIAAFWSAFFLSGLVFVQNYCIKQKVTIKVLNFLPALETMDSWTMRFLLFGFPCMTAALVFGFWLAHQEWRWGWGSDPKVVMALICWGWYALLLTLRFSFGWRGRRLAILNFFGFAAILLTFAAERLLGGQFHRYL